MDNVTILESFSLPSKGVIYGRPLKETFKMRSMTTNDEMKRLSHSEDAYRMLAEVMDDCMLDSLGISCYDLHIGDFQYVLHRLRVVTYGSDYKVQSYCPSCAKLDNYTIDLDSFPVIEFDREGWDKHTSFVLPRSKKQVEIRFQTPRMLDSVASRRREVQKKSKDSNGVDPSLALTVASLLKSVDGKVIDSIKAEQIARSLDMADTNCILQHSMKLNGKVGIDTTIENVCSSCGVDYKVPFRVTSEFFGPSIDD